MTVDILDARFRALVPGAARLERIATGMRWTEGPVWFPDHQCLLFSDIPSDRIWRWTPDGTLSLFRAPSNFANGHTRDAQGRLVSCQHGTRSVTRTEASGQITTLADCYEGKPLNSPNDVVVQRDGTIWFTDPTYGILSDYEGHKAPQEQAHRNVFRLDPDGNLTAVARDLVQPNGLAFSPDETLLYVADSGASHDPDLPRVIRRYRVGDGALGEGADFVHIPCGVPDGMRVDSDGNLWTSAGDGVHCFAPDGTPLGRIAVPEVVSNLTFGGPRGNQMFITASTSVYAIHVDAKPPSVAGLGACGAPHLSAPGVVDRALGPA